MDVPGLRFGSAADGRLEGRTRGEYYQVLRAAVGGTSGETDSGEADSGEADSGEADSGETDSGEADEVSDRGGWDEVDAAVRPPAEDIRLSPERRTHILDGDGTGGGHRYGAGRPGKTEFPADWDDEKTVNAIEDVARRPDQKPQHQEWNGRWVTRGTRDDVGIVAVVSGDGRIWTSWPTPDSPGVTKNPEEP